MGENVDGGRKRTIYMRDTLSLSNINKKNVAPGVRKRKEVPQVYFSPFTAV